MIMELKESCGWYTNGLCSGDFCSACEEWIEYFKNKTPDAAG